MGGIFLLQSCASLVVLIVLLMKFFRHIKKYNRQTRYPLCIIFTGYLFLFLVSLLWNFKYLSYTPKDLLIIYTALLFFQGIAFFKIFHSIKEHKRLIGISIIYFLTSVLLFSEIRLIPIIIVMTQLFLIFLFNHFLKNNKSRVTGILGIIYCSISIFLASFLLSNIKFILFYSIVLNLFFSALIYFFLRDLDKHSFKRKKKKQHSYATEITRYFIFILALTSFIFVGTIAVHEIGHMATSKILGCKYQRIIYEKEFPRTDVLCSNNRSIKFSILGGILFPLIISLFLFIAGGKFIKEIGLLIAGFNLIIAYEDYVALGLTNTLAIGIVFLGIVAIVSGIGFLAKSRTEESEFEKIFKNEKK